MLIAVTLFVLFSGSILLYNPYALSIRNTGKMPLIKRLCIHKGTLILGNLLILVYSFSVNVGSLLVSDDFLAYYGLSYPGVIEQGRLYQLLTSIFIHFDWLHVCSNLLILALLSAYERRVGYRRFFLVFFISALIASLVDLFYLDRNMTSVGASAGICGLVAGYFIDYFQTTWKEWLSGLFLVGIIIGSHYFLSEVQKMSVDYQVNIFAHFIGVLAGAVFIKKYPMGRNTDRPATPYAK